MAAQKYWRWTFNSRPISLFTALSSRRQSSNFVSSAVTPMLSPLQPVISHNFGLYNFGHNFSTLIRRAPFWELCLLMSYIKLLHTMDCWFYLHVFLSIKKRFNFFWCLEQWNGSRESSRKNQKMALTWIPQCEVRIFWKFSRIKNKVPYHHSTPRSPLAWTE